MEQTKICLDNLKKFDENYAYFNFRNESNKSKNKWDEDREKKFNELLYSITQIDSNCSCKQKKEFDKSVTIVKSFVELYGNTFEKDLVRGKI